MNLVRGVRRRAAAASHRRRRRVPLALVAMTLCVAGCDAVSVLISRSEPILFSQVDALIGTRDLSHQDDVDEDGLTDEEEAQLGTDPREKDTDGDLVDDATELDIGTDPTHPNVAETVDGVPSAFDGLIQPGESRTFYRGSEAIATAYLRIMALVREETTLRLDWYGRDDDEVPAATTEVTFAPKQYWYWGHDIGPSALVSDPADMIVTRITVAVVKGDSVFYRLISSGGLDNGPRGPVAFSPILAAADFDFNLLLAHGAFRDASGWDSWVAMLERIAPEMTVLRVSVDPQGTIQRRAGQLSRYVQRQGVSDLYVVAHSQGGLDARYILTKAAFDDPHYAQTAPYLCGLYTLGTPHYGLQLTDLTDGLPEDLFVDPDAALNPSASVIDWMNVSFDADIPIGDRVFPIVSLVFYAEFNALAASDGVVTVASQSFGDHVINDVPSTCGAGPGSGKHVSSIPSRADAEQESFYVLQRVLEDIVVRRASTEPTNPCPRVVNPTARRR